MKSVALRILEYAEKNPEKTAFIFQENSYTYGQLAEGALKAAAWLRLHGMEKGDRVIVEASHTFEYVCFVYGTHLAEGVFAPLEHLVPDERIKDVAGELSVKLIITEKARAEISLEHMHDNKTLSGCYVLTDIWQDVEKTETTGFIPSEPEADQLVEILFTTGTTGKSKGVMVSYKNQISVAKAGIECTNLQEDNIWMIPTPMNHAAGLRKMHMSMYMGAAVCLLDGFKQTKLFFDMIEKSKATSLYLPPSAIHFLLAFAKDELAALDSQIRFIYSSSAAYPQVDKDKMCELMPHVHMYNAFGGSECGVVVSLDFNFEGNKPNSVGKPLSVAKVSIVDENDNVIENSSADNYGFIAVDSDSVTPGYWEEPEQTAKAIHNGILVMSDFGYIDEDGDIILIGRSGDVINLGGMKVAPTEVEAVALTLEGVDDCLLIPAGKTESPSLKLLVVMKSGWEFNKKAMADLLAKSLESYKLPKQYVVVDEIAKTFNGKTDRKKMIEQYR